VEINVRELMISPRPLGWVKGSREEVKVSKYLLDHVMLICRQPRPLLEALDAAGLRRIASAVQPNTGASHAVYFFRNAYLEIAWPTAGGVALQDAPRMHFMQRVAWRETGWCPFGISFRSPDGIVEPPIASWGYPAPFLPPVAIPIPFGENSDISGEPLLFTSLVSGRPDRRRNRPPLQDDCLGMRELTGLRLTLRIGDFSPELRTVSEILPVEVVQGESYRLELLFDNQERGRGFQLEEYPVGIHW
jgi:hypothetical protein